MKINWKVRLKNPVWLASVAAAVVSFVFTMLDLFEVVPAITEDTVMQIVNALLFILGAMGILIDPTTQGVSDSLQALEYTKPKAEDDEMDG